MGLVSSKQKPFRVHIGAVFALSRYECYYCRSMNKRKIIFIILFVTVFATAVFSVFYIMDLPIIDSFLPNKLKEQQVLKRATKLFPESIGSYSLVHDSDHDVNVANVCNKLADNDILRKIGRTGNACMEIFSARYGAVVSSTTSTTTRKIVGVNLSRFTESGDLLERLVKETTMPDNLNNRKIFRTAAFRIGWLPANGFDMIIAEEGESIVTKMINQIKFEGMASGKNDVTTYFISKYPPKK